MYCLVELVQGGDMTTARTTHPALKILAKKSFCTLATTSLADHGHSAGVIYAYADNCLWIHTSINSRKARNIAANPNVGVCVPFRRLPVGPPFTLHFQAKASLVAMSDPRVTAQLETGALKSLTGHGELDMADGCFIIVEPRGRLHSFGPGAKLRDLIRDPINTGRSSVAFAS